MTLHRSPSSLYFDGLKHRLIPAAFPSHKSAAKRARQFMRCGTTVLLLLGLLLPWCGWAQDAQPSEAEVKAAFIFNFVKFIEWPAEAFADAKSPLHIGVLGQKSFSADLERTVRGKTFNNRTIAVKECRTIEEARSCHVLFIAASEERRQQEICGDLGGAAVLTVGEAGGFIQSGGMINFFREGNKFRFEVNPEAAKRARLKVDSKLLSLARVPAK
jgi:hypothetical protein